MVDSAVARIEGIDDVNAKKAVLQEQLDAMGALPFDERLDWVEKMENLRKQLRVCDAELKRYFYPSKPRFATITISLEGVFVHNVPSERLLQLLDMDAGQAIPVWHVTAVICSEHGRCVLHDAAFSTGEGDAMYDVTVKLLRAARIANAPFRLVPQGAFYLSARKRCRLQEQFPHLRIEA